jgi:hypothetical protein
VPQPVGCTNSAGHHKTSALQARPNLRTPHDLDPALEGEGRDPTTLRRTVGIEVLNPSATASTAAEDAAFAGSIDELARAIDAYEELGVDDLLVQLEPKTERSLDRLAEALRLRNR